MKSNKEITDFLVQQGYSREEAAYAAEDYVNWRNSRIPDDVMPSEFWGPEGWGQLVQAFDRGETLETFYYWREDDGNGGVIHRMSTNSHNASKHNDVHTFSRIMSTDVDHAWEQASNIGLVPVLPIRR